LDPSIGLRQNVPPSPDLVRSARFQVAQQPLKALLIFRRLSPAPEIAGKTLTRIGEASELGFPVHPHMLRHACGFKLANDGQDTRALQHYLGHRNIQHTVRYTELTSARFNGFWKD